MIGKVQLRMNSITFRQNDTSRQIRDAQVVTLGANGVEIPMPVSETPMPLIKLPQATIEAIDSLHAAHVSPELTGRLFEALTVEILNTAGNVSKAL